MKPYDFSVQPVSRLFGTDRGKPIDRYYIEQFLSDNRASIHGRVLEVGDNTYTRKYAQSGYISEVLHAVPSDHATLVGDLSTGEGIPRAAFDCIILTQVIHVIYDYRAALKHAVGALKSGGTLLLTAAGISQISRYDMDRWGDYWRFTDKSLRMVLEELEETEHVEVAAHGNVAVAKAFLDGLALEEIPAEVLDHRDPDYQVLLTAKVRRGGR